MKEELINGVIKEVSFFREFKCFFGYHYWACHSPTNEKGEYMDKRQIWTCRNPKCNPLFVNKITKFLTPPPHNNIK